MMKSQELITDDNLVFRFTEPSNQQSYSPPVHQQRSRSEARAYENLGFVHNYSNLDALPPCYHHHPVHYYDASTRGPTETGSNLIIPDLVYSTINLANVTLDRQSSRVQPTLPPPDSEGGNNSHQKQFVSTDYHSIQNRKNPAVSALLPQDLQFCEAHCVCGGSKTNSPLGTPSLLPILNEWDQPKPELLYRPFTVTTFTNYLRSKLSNAVWITKRQYFNRGDAVSFRRQGPINKKSNNLDICSETEITQNNVEIGRPSLCLNCTCSFLDPVELNVAHFSEAAESPPYERLPSPTATMVQHAAEKPIESFAAVKYDEPRSRNPVAQLPAQYYQDNSNVHYEDNPQNNQHQHSQTEQLNTSSQQKQYEYDDQQQHQRQQQRHPVVLAGQFVHEYENQSTIATHQQHHNHRNKLHLTIDTKASEGSVNTSQWPPSATPTTKKLTFRSELQCEKMERPHFIDPLRNFIVNSPTVQRLKQCGFTYPIAGNERNLRKSYVGIIIGLSIALLVVGIIAILGFNYLAKSREELDKLQRHHMIMKKKYSSNSLNTYFPNHDLITVKPNQVFPDDDVPNYIIVYRPPSSEPTQPAPTRAGKPHEPSIRPEYPIGYTDRPDSQPPPPYSSNHDRHYGNGNDYKSSQSPTPNPTIVPTRLPTSTLSSGTHSSVPFNRSTATSSTVSPTPITTTPNVITEQTLLPLYEKNAKCDKIADQFKCRTGVSRTPCLFKWEECDGIKDCSDGSDEEFCDIRHCNGNFQCDDGKCLSLSKVCNGIAECADDSDETHCESNTCKWYESRCPNGYCIPEQWLCDGEMDCFDHSDEFNCSTSCSKSEFLCSEGWCIPDTWRCNGIVDCQAGEDEIGCECESREFKCSTGQCVSSNKVCDGINDCHDWSDEANCVKLTSHDQLIVRGVYGMATEMGVCSTGWTRNHSDILCQQLGHRGAVKEHMVSYNGRVALINKISSYNSPRNIQQLLNKSDLGKCDSNKSIAVVCHETACGKMDTYLSLIPQVGTERRRRRKRIVGGQTSEKHEWPSVGLLFHPTKKWACTGTIIASQWLVTSAQCVRRTDISPLDWKFIAGSSQPISSNLTKDPSVIVTSIKHFIQHPSYKLRSNLADFDVMLVQLSQHLNVDRDIATPKHIDDKPSGKGIHEQHAKLNMTSEHNGSKNLTALATVCLPDQPTEPGSWCFTPGWGYIMPGGYYINKQLKHVDMGIWASHRCNSTDHYNGAITSRMLCAGNQIYNWGPCFNDEGSPLLCQNPRSGSWYLAGVLTYQNCGSYRQHPAVFADVASLKSWISNVVGH